MLSKNLTRHLPENLSHLSRHWEKQRAAAALVDRTTPPGLTIAVARQAGTQGTAMARELGQRLVWPVYDHELLEQIAREMGLHTALLESIDEKRGSWLQESLAALSTVPVVNENKYVRHLLEIVLALAGHGECVIVGRGAAFFLPPQTTLRVRLVAPLPYRITILARKQSISREEAARKLNSMDGARNRFIRDHFLVDPEDSSHLDLTLNAARFSLAECVDLTINALRHRQAKVSQEEEHDWSGLHVKGA